MTDPIRCPHTESHRPPHSCPYAHDVNGDESECVCCEECATACSDDI